jgi:hypothetical protein
VKPAPVGSTQERIISLLSTDSGDAGAAVVHELSPEDAAQLVIERLVAWGYIEDAEAAIDGEPAGRPATTDS